MRQCFRRGQQGYTIQEMLLAILVMVILMAVSALGIAAYVKRLQLTELDNSAREIFLSAQSQAVLLGNERLEPLVVHTGEANRLEHVPVIPDSDATTQITAYYIHKEDANIHQLLPEGSIDPALWEGDFYLIYEPQSGSVVDVFYSDAPLPVEEAGGFPAFYTRWRAAPGEERRGSAPMIGYYGGETAESGTAISLRTPVINIYNENTLRMEITYWIPRNLYMIGEDRNISLEAVLEYQGEQFDLENPDPVIEPGPAYFAYTSTWILDSLEEGNRFRDHFSAGEGMVYGEDFTVTAEVRYDGSLQVNGALKTASDNSLFAQESSGDTASIACVRHLQNLHAGLSGVSGKTFAVQTGDIQQAEDYRFVPIVNSQLVSYDGAGYGIYGLNIAASGAAPAGLFGTFSGTAAEPGILTGIRLVNTAVTAENAPAGALLGQGENLQISDCMVYWVNQEQDGSSLREILGDSASELRYQITSQGTAGGLAGKLEHAGLTGCVSATLVSGETGAGGLIGQGAGLTVKNSYSSSYLRSARAAGLIADLTGEAELSASYAAGFLESIGAAPQAAGLCLGAGHAGVEDAYSAMLFSGQSGAEILPLCENGSYTRTYFLDSEQIRFSPEFEEQAKSYGELTDPAQWGILFQPGIFESKGVAHSHPYNLQTTLTLTAYLYPGIAGLEHWGDWGAQFQNGSLVYYERYFDDTYGFSGSGAVPLQDQLVVTDGYAVVYQSTDPISGIGAVLDITYQTPEGEKTETVEYKAGINLVQAAAVTDEAGKTSNYYLLLLPDHVINSEYASDRFYQKIVIADVNGHQENTYLYNPHFANTVIPYEEGLDVNRLQAEIRSPRHLYNLSRFPAYYSSGNQYRFIQGLDLNYAAYTGYDLFEADWGQAPIGESSRRPFRGSYDGECHTISGVQLRSEDENGSQYQYIGLFGYSTGILRDIVLYMETSQPLTASQSGAGSPVLYAGGLVGGNGGTVENCAVTGVRLEISCYQYSTACVGGFAGLNEGTIRSSAVDVQQITAAANLSNCYAGGFVGENTAGSTMDHCYAVGQVSASRARYGTVYACGFAGRSSEPIRRSYAAVGLQVEGEAKSYGFSPDLSEDCVYLNNGNFTYLGQHYAAQYTDPFAVSVTWEELSGAEESEAVQALRMEEDCLAVQTGSQYPYPGIVEDKTGAAVHYGEWPSRMVLDQMGIYYWEKMENNGRDSYYFSAIYLAEGQVHERSTLSQAHGDGGVITEYGYGFFHESGKAAPELTSQGIYWDARLFDTAVAERNTAADAGLKELMRDQYTFHSYTTWSQEDQQGLHLVVPEDNVGYTDPPYGSWTLDGVFTVRFNPLFADSLALESQPLPGTTENPYQIRSIQQLQFINWYAYNGEKTVNRVAAPGGGEGYMFLNHWLTGNSRQYVWEQTHDLDGSGIDDYTPIAALQDTAEAGKIIAWFSGSYNGNDYTIQEVSIHTENINTTGLFGVTVNADLRNIVLYSPSGSAVISSSNTHEAWYSIGGLVGLAANVGEENRTIENCSIAGYTILDQNANCQFGGGGVGGLVGICNMALHNCTAITEIQLDYEHSSADRNVRVGGIAGSCQQSIRNCYSGGSISLGENFNYATESRLHVGGITGGYFMKTLSFASPSVPAIEAGLTDNRVPSGKITRFEDCYTYIEIDPEVITKSSNYYAIGGLGEIYRYDGSSTLARYDGCYYLFAGQTGSADAASTGVSHCTHSDLSEGGTAYQELLDAGFRPVTTQTKDGKPISGRYSFGIDSSLLGKNYPFPTILTQISEEVEGGEASVHYGNWPIEGIRREDGDLPITLDLFADYQAAEDGTGAAVHTEQLQLSGMEPGGSWEARAADPTRADAQVDQSGVLTVTALSSGNTTVTVSYTAPDGSTSDLDIAVTISAELRLAVQTQEEIPVFADSTMKIPLELHDKNGNPLNEGLLEAITDPQADVTFSGFFESASLDADTQELIAVSKAVPGEEIPQITVQYRFRYMDTDYEIPNALSLSMTRAETAPVPSVLLFDLSGGEVTQTFTGADFRMEINGTEAAAEDLELTGYEEIAAEFRGSAWIEWAKDDQGADRTGELAVTAYPELISVPARVQFGFSHAGCSYTVWCDLLLEAEPAAGGEGEEAP